MNRNVMGSWNGICVAWFLLSLVVSVRSFSCCQFSSGLCRTRCEKVSLMTWTQANTDQNGGGEELVAVRDLAAVCPFRLTGFWQCVNSTIANMVRSASWSGRICCEKAESVQCQETCLIAKTKKDLLPGCRRSDEVVLYSCVNKVENGVQGKSGQIVNVTGITAWTQSTQLRTNCPMEDPQKVSYEEVAFM